MSLAGANITDGQFDALHKLAHDPVWAVVIDWIRKLDEANARACLENPDDSRGNLIRHGEMLRTEDLANLKGLTDSVASATSADRQ